MVLMSDADAQKEAQRLVKAHFDKFSRGPKSTGVSLYKPRPSDVIIATFPKSGTTLLQNMVYQIAVATGGAPSFDPDGTRFTDIAEVTPWIDYGPRFGVLECDTNPRIFKTHGKVERFDKLLTEATYIYCIRDPEQYPASWLDFLFDIRSEEEVKDPRIREQVFHVFVRQGLSDFSDEYSTNQSVEGARTKSFHLGTWFSHVKEWIDTPRENMLILFYEDMLRDLRGAALCVARFMKRALSREGLETVLKRCNREAMLGDPKFKCQIEARGFGFPSGIAEKVKNEDRPGFKHLKIEEEDKQTISRMMKMTLEVDSYAELQKRIHKRQQDNFPDTAYKPGHESSDNGSSALSASQTEFAEMSL